MTRKLANLSQRLASRRSSKRGASSSQPTKLERRALRPSISIILPTSRHLRKEDSRRRIELIVHYSPTIDAPPPIIFFNRRGSCHFQLVDRIYEIYDYSCFFSLVSTNRGRSIHAHQLFRDARLTAAFNLLCGQPISCRWERMDDALPRSQRLTIRRRELF